MIRRDQPEQPLANFTPMIVGVAPPAGEHPRPQEIVEFPVRTAVELRLDLGGAWRAVLDDVQPLMHRLEWLTDDVSEFAPPPVVIATCRREQDGGRFDGDEEDRLEVLQICGRVFDYVDVEAGVKADVPPAKIIRSFHDFEGVPDFADVLKRLRAEGGALVKIVGTAERLSDNLRVRDFLRGKQGVSAFLMGEFGVPSRLLGPCWGSALSYASLGSGEVAPGMVDFQRMVNLYRAAIIEPDWEFFGITGRRVAHSLSPALHNVALSQLNQNRVYLPLAARTPDDFAEFANALPVAGASVTIPYKQELLKHCAKLDEAAEATGAINTMVRLKEGGYRGKNTDVPGFLDDIKVVYKKPLFGRTALVLGAGGAARAVTYALRQEGAKVNIWARTPEQANELAMVMKSRAVDAEHLPTDVDLLVNTTPCGMTGPFAGDIALPWEKLQPLLTHDALVYDLVYDPDETPLTLAATQAGVLAFNGLGMLRRQAALQAAAFGYRLRFELEEPPKFPRHVWLVGYRGAGKSALARELAVKLHRRAVDVDDQIELRGGMKIREIFEQQGEAEFRKLEAAAIEKAAQGKPDVVIAVGGGAVESEQNILRMRSSGVVIWLDASEETLTRRLSSDDVRPSLTGKPAAEEVPEMLARRRPQYKRAAHITFKVQEKPAREQAAELAALLAEYGKA